MTTLLRAACLLSLTLAVAGAADSDLLETFRRKAQLRLAEAALAAHDIDRAQQRLEEALALARKAGDAPDLAVTFGRLGDVYVRRNQLRSARSFYIRALESSGADEAKQRALDRLGRLAARRGRFAEAVEWFQQAAELRSDSDAHLRLGEALLGAGQPERARTAFEQSVANANPAELANLHRSIGRRWLWFARDREVAKVHFDRALNLQGREPQALALALRGQALGDSDETAVESHLSQLSALPGGDALAYQVRARRLAASDLGRAITEQQSAVALLRDDSPQTSALAASLEQLAKFEERRGQDATAAALRREALEIYGESASPITLAAIFALAATLERSGDAAAAEDLWEGYTERLEAGDEAPALAIAAADERFGDFLLRQDRFEEAADRYRHAIEMRVEAWGEADGGLQLVLEKRSDALRLDGREEEARKAEAAIAELVASPPTREPPRGPRDTGTWLSEPFGLAFIGLVLCGATFGLVWAGWNTVTRLQPEIEASFHAGTPGLTEIPDWKPVSLPKADYPLSFRGSGGHLFGIWSINIALTLLTLGLYYFWGKVRVRRYFWGQAELAGDRFAFHGTGRELLFGWLKAAPILALLLWGPSLLGLISENPRAGLYGAGIAILAVGMLWPVAEIGASRYRLSRTSWRAIRFSFSGSVWPYVKLWISGMALWILTLGLWAPFFDVARRRYLMKHTHFGDARFECDIHGKDLFAFYLVTWALYLPTAGASHFWYKALSERYFWSRTQLVHNEGASHATFECSLKGIDLLVLWIQTMFTLTFTLGLGWPWTRVWEARLRLQTISLAGDFRAGRIRQSASSASAAGEGAADFLGLDFGFFA